MSPCPLDFWPGRSVFWRDFCPLLPSVPAYWRWGSNPGILSGPFLPARAVGGALLPAPAVAAPPCGVLLFCPPASAWAGAVLVRVLLLAIAPQWLRESHWGSIFADALAASSPASAAFCQPCFFRRRYCCRRPLGCSLAGPFCCLSAAPCFPLGPRTTSGEASCGCSPVAAALSRAFCFCSLVGSVDAIGVRKYAYFAWATFWARLGCPPCFLVPSPIGTGEQTPPPFDWPPSPWSYSAWPSPALGGGHAPPGQGCLERPVSAPNPRCCPLPFRGVCLGSLTSHRGAV